MYALVDCNNFYCSCERLFTPQFDRRPVVVLSNNDGCAIARSEEAKALGIEMGTPAFLLEPQIKKHNIAVFSSNYTLYGDMSDRVMKLLGGFAPNIEIYSIDETFLDLHSMPFANLLELGMNMRNTVSRHTGIPTLAPRIPFERCQQLSFFHINELCYGRGPVKIIFGITHHNHPPWQMLIN